MQVEESTKTKHLGKKIYTYVSKEEVKQLETICETYNFKSVYELQKHLVSSFLRSVDPTNDTNTSPIPKAIEEMFLNMNRIK